MADNKREIGRPPVERDTEVDGWKIALSILVGALCGTVFVTTLFLADFRRSMGVTEDAVTRKHAEMHDLENVKQYLSSVKKIYRTIRTVSPFVSEARAKQIAPMFKHISDESGIPISTCLLIAKVESDFRAVRSGNDYGIMQINRFWLNRYNVNPEEAMNDWNNLQLFVKIMRELSDKPLSYYHSWTPSVRARYEKRLETWAAHF